MRNYSTAPAPASAPSTATATTTATATFTVSVHAVPCRALACLGVPCRVYLTALPSLLTLLN